MTKETKGQPFPRVYYVIKEHFPVAARSRAMAAAIGHAFGVVPTAKLKPFLDKCGVKTRLFTVPVVEDTHFLRECKAYLYAHTVDPYTNRRDYGVNAATANLLHKTVDENKDLKQLLARLASKYPAYTLPQLDQLIAGALTNTDFQTYIGKFVSRKMAFMLNDGLAKEDIKQDLLLACHRSMLKTYPVFNDAGHIQALIKRTAHNQG